MHVALQTALQAKPQVAT
jgi:hypothetical protein